MLDRGIFGSAREIQRGMSVDVSYIVVARNVERQCNVN